VVVYEQMVTQMVAEGVNCAFTYADLGSNVNFVKALASRGVWPQDKCTGPTCFSSVYVPFAAYDPKFIRDAGDASRNVITFIPHIPLNETSSTAMQQYLNGLKTVKGAEPSTFSLVGWSAGQMFVQAVQSCGAAPTRKCVMEYLRNLKDFDAGGLQGAVTPFRSTRVDCSGGCGSFGGKGVYNFKWIFACNVGLQVQDRNGKRDFFRVNPAQGYACDELRVARGKPA
jgi:ABC-type branched-subunit amino acid transport system substrate-binding protein